MTDSLVTKDEPFNPHGNRTADGVLITEGLRVYTNDMDRGHVVGKAHDGDYGRVDDWWWYVVVDIDWRGNPVTKRMSMNGERMATRFEGRPA